MVRQCFLCRKWSYSNPNLSFHRFPSDDLRRNAWVKSLKLEAFAITQSTVICSDHFAEDDFCMKANSRFLKKSAIPLYLEQNTESGPSYGFVELEQKNIEGTQSSELSTNISITETASEKGEDSPLQSAHSSTTQTASEPEWSATEKELESAVTPSKKRYIESKEEDIQSISTVSTNSSTTRTASELEYISYEPKSGLPSLKRKRPAIDNLSSSDFASPRKAKKNFRRVKTKLFDQKKKISYLQQVVRRQRHRIHNLKSLITVLSEKRLISENSEATIMASLPESAREIFERMLKGAKKQKYTPELRSFALTLSFYSRKAYTFLRNTFNNSLPHLNTISSWYQAVDGSPGWTLQALKALEVKVEEAARAEQKVICNLVFDEMAIRRQIEWTGKKFTGYVDIGTKISGDTDEAKEVLVFMVVSLNSFWKIPVGYFLLNGLPAREKASLVNQCLEKLHSTGVIVTSITFDGAPTNLSMARILGADFEDPKNLKTSFFHPITKQKVFIFLDPCHMIKLVRNCLGEYKMLKQGEGRDVDWGFLIKLVEFQYKEGLHAGNKLRKRHITFTKEKMKVRLATQLLSKSVADSLRFLAEDVDDFKSSTATSEFIQFFNDLFDIFNSRNQMVKYEFKKPLSPINKENVFEYLETINKYILYLSFGGKPIINTARKTGFLGFLICIQSLKDLYVDIIEKKSLLKYILTYKLSQDHLELFFGSVRSCGGLNNNPTARQFESAYKRLIVLNQIRDGKSGSVINIDSISILHCNITKNLTLDDNNQDLESSKQAADVEKSILSDIEQLDFLTSSAWDLTDYVADVVGYISGFVVKSLKKVITCGNCLSLLESATSVSKLQDIKTFKKLTNASELVVVVCKWGEKYFRFFDKTTCINNRNIENLMNVLINNTV